MTNSTRPRTLVRERVARPRPSPRRADPVRRGAQRGCAAVTVAPAFAAGGDPATSGRGESQLRARLRTLRGDATRIESADEVLGLLDGGRLRRADGLADLVDRASERAVRAGVDRVIQMPPPLCDMLPGRGLRRGSTVAVRGSTSMLFVMLAAATRGGCWCAVVGMQDLGLVAADELKVDLERLALVPNPGPDWPEVVAALLDGIDLVVVAAPTATAPVAGASFVGTRPATRDRTGGRR